MGCIGVIDSLVHIRIQESMRADQLGDSRDLELKWA